MSIIGISGYIGSGKTTLGNILKDLIPNSELKSYGDKLKQIASLLTGIPVEKFEDQEFKKKTFKQLAEEGYISKDLLNLLTNI